MVFPFKQGWRAPVLGASGGSVCPVLSPGPSLPRSYRLSRAWGAVRLGRKKRKGKSMAGVPSTWQGS